MCEITKQMIETFAQHFNIDLADGSQEPGVIGSLNTWAEGKGELDAALVNGNPVFTELVESYYKANGQEVPESVKIPLTPVEGAENSVVEEKLPESETANT